MKPIRIDWRDPLAQLENYIANKGGILGVVGTPLSAFEAFVELVKENIENRQEGNICILLDAGHSNTYRQQDIIVWLEEHLGVESEMPAPAAPAPATIMGKDIDSDGPVTISGNTITNTIYYEQSNFGISVEERNRTNRIAQSVQQMLEQNRRVALILYNWHKADNSIIKWFWRNLWGKQLDGLIAKGFLVLCMSETDDGLYPYNRLMPDLEPVIQLCSKYDRAAREHAREDIADLLAQYKDEERAFLLARADSLLDTWANQPSKVHGGIIGHLSYLKNEQWN